MSLFTAGFRTGSHNVRKEELADTQSSDSNTPAEEINPKREATESRRSKSKQRQSVGVVRARPVSAGRKHTRIQSNRRSNSSENLYSSSSPVKVCV